MSTPKKNNAITRSELKFWIPLVVLAIGGAIAFATLRAEIKAQAQFDEGFITREQLNKDAFQTFSKEITKTVGDINKTVIRMETNQGHIMRELGISNE